MTTQHTQGPWQYIPDDGTGTLPAVLSAHVNAGGNFYVAQCNVDADARLIAATLDMLAALEAIHTALTNGEIQFTKKRNGNSDPYHPANVLLTAALAKVRGE